MITRDSLRRACLVTISTVVGLYSFQWLVSTFDSVWLVLCVISIAVILTSLFARTDPRSASETMFSVSLTVASVLALAVIYTDFSAVGLDEGFDMTSGYSYDAVPSGVTEPVPLRKVSVDPLLMRRFGAWYPLLFTTIAYGLIVICFSVTAKILGRIKAFSRWEVIRGIISLYIATGLIFAAAYKVSGGLRLLGNKIDNNFDYIYFSFICLSTTGFGDIVPTATVAKLLTMLEPLVGGYLLFGIFVAAAFTLPERLNHADLADQGVPSPDEDVRTTE
jgi:hypothetical protein